MNTVTQTMLYRQALINYANKKGVTKTAIRYKTNRQYIYRWQKRYDGTLQSLADKSHRPHHHPNEHTAEELKLIADMRKRNMNAGLVVFWVKLRQRGYTRSVTGYIAFYADKVKWLLNRQTQSMWQNDMNKCNFPVKEFK